MKRGLAIVILVTASVIAIAAIVFGLVYWMIKDTQARVGVPVGVGVFFVLMAVAWAVNELSE